MTSKKIDELYFAKTLASLFEECKQAKVLSNDGKFHLEFTKYHFDYIISQRINHNQFIHQGIVFNLVRESLQLTSE